MSQTATVVVISPLPKEQPLNIFYENKSDKPDECIICLQTLNLTPNLRCSCKYFYHQTCINSLENPNKCIICKKELQEEKNEENECCTIIASGIVIILIITLAVVLMSVDLYPDD
jgi:hypothetical protein